MSIRPAYVGRLRRFTKRKLVTAVLALAAVPLASLTAGAQIRTHGPSAAPLVEVGKTQTITHDGRDYWRLRLAARDQLSIIAFTPISADGIACLYAPGVTDATVEQTRCILSVDVPRAANPAAGMASEFGWPPSSKRGVGIPGDWVLAFAEKGCPTCRFSYSFFVRVARGTTTTLTGPRGPRPGRPFVLRGRVQPAGTGTVALSRRTGRGWRDIGTTDIRRSGSFSLRTKVDRRALARFRARYSGDGFHRASVSNTLSVQVA
jgi:hypothetical protein